MRHGPLYNTSMGPLWRMAPLSLPSSKPMSLEVTSGTLCTSVPSLSAGIDARHCPASLPARVTSCAIDGEGPGDGGGGTDARATLICKSPLSSPPPAAFAERGGMDPGCAGLLRWPPTQRTPPEVLAGSASSGMRLAVMHAGAAAAYAPPPPPQGAPLPCNDITRLGLNLPCSLGPPQAGPVKPTCCVGAMPLPSARMVSALSFPHRRGVGPADIGRWRVVAARPFADAPPGSAARALCGRPPIPPLHLGRGPFTSPPTRATCSTRR